MANAQDYIVVDKDGQRIAVGDTVKDFRGETYILSGFQPPRHEGSTGRVDLRDPVTDEYAGEFFPTVIGATIRKR